MALSHFIHYQYTKNAAKIKLAQRLGFDTIEDVYNSFGNKLEERKNFEKAVEAYSDAYADLQNSFNFSLPKKYETASEAQIQNWGEARKLFDKLYPGGDLSDFDSEDFQEALFEQFFEPDPSGGEDEEGNPLKYKPRDDSAFAIDGESTMDPAENDALREWLKNGGNGNYESPYKVLHDTFNDATTTQPIPVDPLLIDLDGDGIETTTIQNGVYFDHENDGFAESSSWVGEDDGILAFDKDNNGYIDDGNEIFGDNYIKSDGSKATSGFDALSDFDSNHDGVINSQDEKYSQLKILKGDGSLLTLEEAGIESINLNSTASNIVDASGNTQLTTGTYTKTDGTSGELGDYSLQNDKMDSVATDWVDIPADVQELPNIIGHGSVYSLQQAIVRDTSGELKELVESFVNATDISSKRDLVVQILYKWTGADQIDPNSRGSNINAQQLYVLEKFMGENFVGVDGSGNPNNQACNLLNNAFAMLRDNIYAQLQSQTELKPLYDLLDLQYNSVSQKYVYNIDAVQQYIDSQIKIDATSGKELLTDFVQTFLALGLDDMSNYTSFYEHFASMGDDYKFLMETADKVITYGTDDSDNIEGTAQQEAVFAGAGNDTIYTRQGDDLVYGGNGDDYIDTCEDNDIIFGEDGNDTINTGSGNDVVYGGSGNDSIYNSDGNDYIDGGDGDDYIETRSGNDTIVGGRGNDSIFDNFGGNETFIYNLGDGNDTIYNYGSNDSDTIQFGDGITPENVRFQGEDSDLFITFEGSDGSIRIQNALSSEYYKIENFTFEDGTSYSYNDVLSLLLSNGTSENDNIRGSIVSETIKGNDGNDSIDALEGNDTIYGGAGADTINTDYGDDVVYGGSGNDSIYNSDGNDYIDGGDGDDYIETRSGNDTIIGGRGNDSIFDNFGGNDTFIYNLGDGNDTIYNYGSNDSDTIQFGDGITPENVRFQGEDSDLVITFEGSDGSIRIQNALSSEYYKIENFTFGDGTNYTYEDVLSKLVTEGSSDADSIRGSIVGETIKGEAGNDSIDALEGNDTIYGGAGADTINTGSGDDVVYGGSGNDSIYNSDGNDYIDGGDGDDYIETRSGNDTIVGGRGNDSIFDNFGGNETFIYNLGDGNDTIYNYGSNDSDTIQFGDTVALENIAFFTDSSGNLIIDYGEQSGNNTIKINNQNSSSYAIESFEAKDATGTTHLLTNEDINKLIQDMSAYAAENGITISSAQDVKDNPDLMNLVNSAWVA